MENEEIIEKVKEVISDGNPCPGVNWVLKVNNEDSDINRALQIAYKMIQTHKYIRVDGHSNDDIYVVENLEYENRKYDLLGKKWVYKTRWWPIVISLIALIISILVYARGG
jgi:hypothetical protein